MKKQLSMLAILVGASLNAQAAQAPFFTITDVDQGYASGISADGEGLVGINTTNNMAEYFSTVRFADFLVDRFRFYGFDDSCILSENVCDTFWDEEPGFAHQWRLDFLNGVDQRRNIGISSGSETDGLITALGDSSATRVGYKTTGDLRTAFASVENGNPIDLKDAVSNDHSLSVPTSIKKLAEGYVITGTAATGIGFTKTSEPYKLCFDGDDDEDGDYRFCPGLNTQASFWLLNAANDGVDQLLQATDYGRPDNDVVQTASALGVAEIGGTLYGVGYSSTGEVGNDWEDGRNLASYWTLNLSEKSVGPTQIIPLKEGQPSDDDDTKLRHSWAVGVNDNGYVIGNQRWEVGKNQNRPVEMFVFNLNTKATASVPLQDQPINGSGSEAAAINNHDMVVGWRDSRHQTQPVVDGTNRMQEAFLLNAANGKNWYLNDLICSGDANAKKCDQNGKFYHIAYASGISSDGTIAATAYRYNSESDLNNRTGATVVAVKLTPAEVDYKDIPADFIIPSAPANDPSSQDGGGSLFWLTLLALPFAWLRRYQR